MAVEVFLDAISGPTLNTQQSAAAITWAAALPSLLGRIDDPLWWKLLNSLLQLRESTLQLSAMSSPGQLLIGGELGLTLAWRLADLPAGKRLEKSAVAELDQWFAGEIDSISAAVTGAVDTRLVLASILRCQRILAGTRKIKLKKRQLEIASDVAVWTAALTQHGGTSALSKATRSDVRDDLAPHGLLREAVALDMETLGHAISAALGESRSNGRLAWKVSLPEAMQHSDDAKLAVMMPEWDVRRGRLHVDYSGETTMLELFAGKLTAISGPWQVMLEVDGEEQHAKANWEYTCEYSDDDVHYLELEQAWTGGVVLQRQFMLSREDRCVLIADSVMPAEDSEAAPMAIRYTSRLSVADDLKPRVEQETREVFLTDGSKNGKAAAMVLPLGANEWRVGPTSATLAVQDNTLVLDVTSRGPLYAPLWFDFQSRRFDRPRTWRQLTIVDELRIVAPTEAVGFRVQVGSEQWLVYRSLGKRRCRSVLGKHLISDFFSGRFDPEDGNIDELVTVDDSEHFDE